jgi:hypothetical protein
MSAKVYMNVSNRMTVGALAKRDDVKRVMDQMLTQKCDIVNVHRRENEGEIWESFTLEYNEITPDLREFLTKVGDLRHCIVQYRGWTWNVNVTDTTATTSYDFSQRGIVINVPYPSY